MPGRDRHGRREPLQILDAANRRIRQLLGAHHGYRKWNLLYTFRNAPRRNDNIFDASALGPIVGRSILRRWLLPVRLKGETGRRNRQRRDRRRKQPQLERKSTG